MGYQGALFKEAQFQLKDT